MDEARIWKTQIHVISCYLEEWWPPEARTAEVFLLLGIVVAQPRILPHVLPDQGGLVGAMLALKLLAVVGLAHQVISRLAIHVGLLFLHDAAFTVAAGSVPNGLGVDLSVDPQRRHWALRDRRLWSSG